MDTELGDNKSQWRCSMATRKYFSKEFKLEAVRLLGQSSKSGLPQVVHAAVSAIISFHKPPEYLLGVRGGFAGDSLF